MLSKNARYFLSIIQLILFGNVFIAIGAVCLVQSTGVQLNFDTHLPAYSALVFFATLFIYNLQRVFYKPQQDTSLVSVRRKWIFENQTLVKALTFIGFTGVLISFFFMDAHVFLPLLIMFVFSLAYFIPAVKLRKHPLFKLLTLVVVWVMVTAVLPILLSGRELFTQHNFIHVLLRFCFITAIAIPFDIRDLKIDAADNVYTLSRIIGENKAKWLAFGLMLLYIVLVLFGYELGVTGQKVFFALIVSATINALLVLMGGSSKRSEYFYLVLVDGTMIVQGAALLTAQWLF